MPFARDEAGNVWETDAAGNPVRYVPPETQAPADPGFQYEGQQAAATLDRSRAEAERSRATLPADVRRAAAEAAKAEAEAARGPQLTATEMDLQAKREGESRRANTIRALMGEVRGLYESNLKGNPATRLFGATEGIIPGTGKLPKNEEFTAAANKILPLIRPLVAQTAKEGDSDREMMIFQSYIPAASDNDRTIERKLRSLEILIGGMVDGKSVSQMIEGGEFAEGLSGKGAYGGDLGNGPPPAGGVWENTQEFVGNDPLLAAASNPDKQSIPIPQAMQDEHRAFIASGNWTPEQYAEFRVGLDRKYADQLTRLGADYEVDTNRYGEYLEGGKQLRGELDAGDNLGNIPAMEAPVSLLDTIRNMGANNPVGAGAIGALNMGGFGGVEALAPEQYAAMEGEYPLSTLGGEVGGAILGTSMLGKAGREAAGLLPRGGARLRNIMGREGSFKRNLATDATYGAGYGTVTEGDPLNAGIAAGAGSTLGQLVGRVAGAAIGGVRQSDAVQRLLAEGIPLSPMRRLGPFAAKVEDAATSIPITGDLIEARARDSMGGFDRAAFKEAYSRAGAVPRGIAEEGIGQGRVIQSDVYRQALGGRSFNANDPAFIEAVKKDLAQAANLPTLGEETTYIIRDAIEPFVDQSGQISGENLQAALQTLTRAAGTMGKSQSAIGPRAADVLRGAKGSVEGMAGRQAPDVIPALEDANYTYRMGETLRDAVSAAKNREGIFTPAQLGMAAEKSARRYGNNAGTAERPFFNLQRAGQEVLPSKINDSGTGRRLIQATALGTGAGALTGAASSNDALGGAQTGAGYGAAAPVTLGALLALLNTRRGQSAFNALLFKRGDLPKNLGRIIRDQQGLLGSASVPLMIGAGQ